MWEATCIYKHIPENENQILECKELIVWFHTVSHKMAHECANSPRFIKKVEIINV